MKVNEDRFRQMINQAGGSFFVHDRKGNLSDVNRQARTVLGYTRSELLRLNLADQRMYSEKS